MNIFFSNSGRRGFTLIELLVVIFIIGVLSAVIFPRFEVMREKARDTERMTDVRQIQNALELYYNRYGAYPGVLTDSRFTPLMSSGVPRDPLGGDYVYRTGSVSSCGGGAALYSLRFSAENPNTFAGDTTITMVGPDTVCIDLVRN